MRNKRKRHESGHGTTSQAFNCSKYSLLCYRALSEKPDGSPIEWELLSEWEKRLRLTRFNTIHMIEAARRWLYLQKFNHRYYVSPREECAAEIEAYILFKRKNHPARKGIGKNGVVKSGQIDALNRLLYPGGVNLWK
ncbi:MAG: hypothetical protein ACKPHV_02320 [Microcystis panniformis]